MQPLSLGLAGDGYWRNCADIRHHGLLYYKRRLKQIQSVVDELDPHLLSAVIDRNIIITQVTQALCDVTGFDTLDLVGKPHLFYHPLPQHCLIYYLELFTSAMGSCGTLLVSWAAPGA